MTSGILAEFERVADETHRMTEERIIWDEIRTTCCWPHLQHEGRGIALVTRHIDTAIPVEVDTIIASWNRNLIPVTVICGDQFNVIRRTTL